MKSKTSFFNRTIFFSLYKRFWPIFAGYLAIWLVVLPASLQNSLKYAVEQAKYSEPPIDITLNAAEQVMRTSLYGGVIMSAAFALFIAMAAYSYLYNARSVSMMCSLPIKREGVFLTVTAAGILGMLIPNVIVFVITAAVEAAFGALSMSYLLQGLAALCLMNLFFFGFAALCASFTGHILVLPAVYVVLNFTVIVVEQFVNLVLRVLLYGFNESLGTNLVWFSPFFGIYTHTSVGDTGTYLADGSYVISSYFYSNWGMLLIYAAVGIIFAFCAMLLIKHRRMETASDVVAVAPLKPIFKYCMCVGCALVLGCAGYYSVFQNQAIVGMEAMAYLLLFMLLGAFIGYFAADMLMKKTLRVFGGRNFIGFAITAAIIAGLSLSAELDVFGYEHRIPEQSEIETVSMSCNGEFITLEEPENLELTRALHSDIIENKALNEDAQRSGQYFNYYNVDLTYILKNEKIVKRNYKVYADVSDDLKEMTDIFNTDEAIAFRKNLNIPLSEESFSYANISYFDEEIGESNRKELSAQQLMELYNTCIMPDMTDRTLGLIYFVTDDDFNSSIYDCQINFELRERREEEYVGGDRYKYDYFNTTVTVSSQRTKVWIEENLGIKLITQQKSNEIRYSTMSDYEREKYGYDMESTMPVAAAVEAESVYEG